MRRPTWLLAASGLVLVKIFLHAWSQWTTAYGFHRDEFLYLAMGDHLSLWGMDFPPFIAVAGNAQRLLFGDVLWGIKVLPALAGAVLVWLSMDVARRLGASVLGQILAGGIILLAPLFLRTSALFQPVVFDQLWWSLALWGILRRGQDDDPRWWLAVGAALGMGLFTKFSIAFLVIPASAAVVVTSLRKDLATRWPWLGAGLSLVLGHPSLAGQVALGWPFFTQMADLQAAQLSRVTYGSFLVEQFMLVGPGALLAVLGALWLVGARGAGAQETAARRVVGLAAAGAFFFLLLMHGKPYYAGPVYPLLVGAGAAALTRAATRRETVARRWTRRGALGLVGVTQALYGAVALPMGLPILPPEPMAEYAARLSSPAATTTNRGELLDLPQDYADMLGWEAFADTVIRVWNDLPPQERDQAVLFASNYGRAGALDWYGRSAGLPPVVSNVGSYWFWGPGDREWNVAVVAGSDPDDLAAYFGEVTLAARVRDPRRVPEERDVSVFVVRRPYESIADVWPRFEGMN